MTNPDLPSDRPLPADLERFKFEDMEVFKLSRRIADLADDLAISQRRARPWVANQIGRSGLSTMNNTAEALGEKSPGDKARFFRYATRSATETAAMIVFLGRRALITLSQEIDARRLLLTVIKTLTRKAIHFQRQAR